MSFITFIASRQPSSFDTAFGKFFTRLAADGMENTLFVNTADENDHCAGSAPTPAGCDGVNVPCTYLPGHKGEVDANLDSLSLFLGEFIFVLDSTWLAQVSLAIIACA
jgi:hypothetical protein